MSKKIIVATHVGAVTRCPECGNIAMIAGDGEKPIVAIELTLEEWLDVIGELIEATDSVINERGGEFRPDTPVLQ